jgi:TRAP-type mannitol/chloroaromatic compound transport system substrate-binding protein
MGEWFRKEIREVSDLKGLKLRMTIQRLDGIPQQITGGDRYLALERGTIGAAEGIGLYDTRSSGSVRSRNTTTIRDGGEAERPTINLDKWNELLKRYQSIIADPAAFANSDALAKNDARNPAALLRLLASGTDLRAFSQPIMQACVKDSNEVNGETAAINAGFKRALESMQAFAMMSISGRRLPDTSTTVS